MLVEMRNLLNKWIVETGDQGQAPESEAMYNSDMKVYVDNIKERMDEIMRSVRSRRGQRPLIPTIPLRGTIDGGRLLIQIVLLGVGVLVGLQVVRGQRGSDASKT